MEIYNSDCIYTWDEETDGLKLVKCQSNPDVISVPDQVDGKPVTMIGEYAFSNVKSAEIQGVLATVVDEDEEPCNLKKIKIPDTVKIINYCAFYGCHDLEYVDLPEHMDEVRAGAFCFCENLEDIELPEGIKIINRITFRGCRSLTYIQLPESVEEIDFSAFEDCDALEDIYIDDRVEKIGNRAFWGCKNLEELELPDSVVQIGIGAFGESGLRELFIPSRVDSISPDTFRNSHKLQRISVKAGCHVVPGAFNGNDNVNVQVRSENNKVKAICLHYAGGNSGWFDSWIEKNAENLEICPIQLPGRFARIDEIMPNTMEALASQLIDECEELLKDDYIIFGHSMGAQLAFEIALQLEKRNAKLPKLIVLSACEAPVVAEIERTKVSSLKVSEDELINVLKEYGQIEDILLENQDFRDYYLPIVRADFHLCETYVKDMDSKVTPPLLVFRGDNDSSVSQEGCECWLNYTYGECTVETLHGGHFFPEENIDKIMNMIEDNIRSETMNGGNRL